ncbi:MAG: extracellular solute-binding protein [Ruminiclostridium sp.]|nr:extracellular solute-binding protein [Ruminiclostridium sp.]
MKHKKILSFGTAVVLAASMGSCADKPEAAPTRTSPPEASTTTAAATLASEDKEALAQVETTYEKLENGTIKFLSSWDINPADGKPKQVSLEMFETNYGGKIEYIPCTWESRYEALGKMIAAGDSPDMFSAGDLDCFPQGAVSKMFLPLDDYVDFDSELWAPMKEVNDQFMFKDKHYVGATSTDAGVVMIYNQKTIDENGLADPAKLLEEDNWTWDTFYDMMIAFCDRTNEKYAVDGWWFEGAISLTTGVPYVGMKDGKIVQNLDDPMIEQVQRFMYNMKKQDLPFPKSEYGWQIHPENIANGKTLFYPCGIWALYVTDLSDFGEMDEIRFVPMPRCPYADAHYLPTAINGFTLCSGAKNPEGVAAYLDCLMLCRDNEVALEIEQAQIFEDYKWTPEMYDMLLKTREMTEQHPVIEFYTAVNDTVNDLVNNPIKETYNAGVSWTETKETIKFALQAELDSVNTRLE